MPSRARPFRAIILAGITAALLAGCSSSRSIEALPPSPAVPPVEQPERLETTTMSRILVNLLADATSLPPDVDTVRFRISELRFRLRGGGWESFPISGAPVSVSAGEQATRVLLNTQIRPGAYDSVQVTLGDVYLEFAANAGGPVTTGQLPAAARAAALQLSAATATSLDLTLDAGASLSRDSACRWYFLPFLAVNP